MMLHDAHALAVGVSQYSHLRPLPATQDAQDVASVLCDGALGAYPAANVRSLIDGDATRAAILGELDGLAARTNEQSTVLVYFSGHGGRSTRGRETCYLMPIDGRDDDEAALDATAISGAELSARLRKIPAAKLTVVLDCCRASGIAEPRDVGLGALVPELSGEGLAPLARGRGRAVLAASRSDGYAYVVPGARNGVFTGYLLDGLRGGAGGAGGVIRVCDLFHYVQQRVAAGGGTQRPVFKAELEENYPVALYRGGAAPALVVPPPPPDGFLYDVFLSYRHSDRADRQFVLDVVVPLLERLGLRVCLEHRDFQLGSPRIREMERAIIRSRYTVGLFTPSYVEGPFEELQMELARYQATEEKAPRFIPLQRRECALTLGVRMTELLDVSDDAEVERALQRLALRLREPPHPRLG